MKDNAVLTNHTMGDDAHGGGGLSSFMATMTAGMESMGLWETENGAHHDHFYTAPQGSIYIE